MPDADAVARPLWPCALVGHRHRDAGVASACIARERRRWQRCLPPSGKLRPGYPARFEHATDLPRPKPTAVEPVD